MKDDRDPVLLGIALGRERERAGVERALSEIADRADLTVPAHDTPEARDARARLNGDLDRHFAPRRTRPAAQEAGRAGDAGDPG